MTTEPHSITPETWTRVEQLAHGRGVTVEGLLCHALDALEEIERRHAELKEEIQRRIAEADAGDLRPLDLEAFKAEARAGFRMTE